MKTLVIGIGNMTFSNENNRNIMKDMDIVANLKSAKIEQNSEENDKAIFNEVKAFLIQLIE